MSSGRIEYNDLVNPNVTAEIKKLEAAIRGVSTEAKKVKVGMPKDTTNPKQLNQLQKEAIRLEQRYNDLSKEGTRANLEKKEAIRKKTQALKDDIRATSKSSDAYTKLQASLDINVRKYRALAAQNKHNTAEGKRLRKELQKQDAKLKQIDATTGRFQRGVGKYPFRGMAESAKSALLPLIGLAAAVRTIGGAVRTMIGFELGMAKVKAISGASSDEFQQLKQSAKDLGAATQFTASEVAGLQLEYSKLGFTTKEILAATGATISLATATGEDLAQASEVAGSTIRAFGMDATETQRVVDVMARSFTSSALNLTRFQESMKYVAPVAKSLGISLEETTAQLSALADSGIHGSQAGTALRKIYQEMGNSGLEAGEAFKKLTRDGLTLADANDEVGARAQSALLILSNQKEKIDELTGTYNNAAGASAEMAAIIENTTSGSIKKLGSAWDGFILSLGNSEGAIKGVIDGFTNLITAITELIEGNRKGGKTIAAITKALLLAVATWGAYVISLKAAVLWQNAHNASTKIGVIVQKAGTIATAIYSTTVGIATGKIKIATIAQRVWNLAMKMNPIGVLIAGITALVGAVILFSKKTDLASKSQRMFNELQKELTSRIADQKANIEPLIRTLNDENAANTKRIEAYNELKKIAPDIIGNLTFEEAKVKDLTKSYDAYIKSLEKEIKTQLYKDQVSDLIKQEEELKQKIKEQTEDMAVAADEGWGKRALKNLSKLNRGFMLDKLAEELKDIQALKEQVYGKLSENNETDDSGGLTEAELKRIEEEKKAQAKLLAEKEAALKEYNAEIEKLKDEQYRKSLSKDAQELLDIDEKYKKLYELAAKAEQDIQDLKGMHESERDEVLDNTLMEAEKALLNEMLEFEKNIDAEIDKSDADLMDKMIERRIKQADLTREQAEEELEIEQEKNLKKLDLIDGYGNAAMDLMGSISSFQQAKMNKELEAAGDNEQKKEQIQREYARKQQNMAALQAVIQGALGIVKTGANLGYPAAIPFQIIQGIQTLAQIALIKSQQFKDGEVNIRGARHSQGGIAAEIEGGESVINREGTRNAIQTLKLINTGQLRDNDIMPFIANMKGFDQKIDISDRSQDMIKEQRRTNELLSRFRIIADNGKTITDLNGNIVRYV